jgi:hypothetical protein
MNIYERARRPDRSPTMCDIPHCYRTGQWSVFLAGHKAGDYCESCAKQFGKLFDDGSGA